MWCINNRAYAKSYWLLFVSSPELDRDVRALVAERQLLGDVPQARHRSVGRREVQADHALPARGRPAHRLLAL